MIALTLAVCSSVRSIRDWSPWVPCGISLPVSGLSACTATATGFVSRAAVPGAPWFMGPAARPPAKARAAIPRALLRSMVVFMGKLHSGGRDAPRGRGATQAPRRGRSEGGGRRRHVRGTRGAGPGVTTPAHRHSAGAGASGLAAGVAAAVVPGGNAAGPARIPSWGCRRSRDADPRTPRPHRTDSRIPGNRTFGVGQLASVVPPRRVVERADVTLVDRRRAWFRMFGRSPDISRRRRCRQSCLSGDPAVSDRALGVGLIAIAEAAVPLRRCRVIASRSRTEPWTGVVQRMTEVRDAGEKAKDGRASWPLQRWRSARPAVRRVTAAMTSGGEAKTGGTFIFAGAGDPKNFDPIFNDDGESFRPVRQMYDTLISTSRAPRTWRRRWPRAGSTTPTARSGRSSCARA